MDERKVRETTGNGKANASSATLLDYQLHLFHFSLVLSTFYLHVKVSLAHTHRSVERRDTPVCTCHARTLQFTTEPTHRSFFSLRSILPAHRYHSLPLFIQFTHNRNRPARGQTSSNRFEYVETRELHCYREDMNVDWPRVGRRGQRFHPSESNAIKIKFVSQSRRRRVATGRDGRDLASLPSTA